MQAIPRYLIAAAGALAIAACGDGTSPGEGDDRAAARFDELADSLAGGGDYARADALRHAAVIVRLTGDPTPVTLTIDGLARRFVAVAEELEYPNLVCSWPGDSGGGGSPPDPDRTPPDTFPPPPLPPHEPPMPPRDPPVCEPAGTYRMRALIAWEPDRMEEVVRLVADEGRGAVEPGIPDPMAGPTHEGEGWGGSERPHDPPPSPDSTVTSPPFDPGPGFMGEYLDRATGFWWSVSGSQANSLEKEGGPCRRDEVEFDWARYSCQSIRVRFEFTIQVQRIMFVPFDGWTPRDPPEPSPVETRDIAMDVATVNGARLTLLEWLPPPVEPPFPRPDPPDSAWTEPAGAR